ncbi:MAG: NAD(P)-dependent alcohol dehydrogenase [Bacteroidetes bacterium]|nr:NAD(P)-dependent alcohol dehydrogenase [Bacteroidota bacterium]
MKAIKYNSYGKQDKMYVADIPISQPEAKQILVKIKATSINPVDWKTRNGDMKLFINKQFPKGMGVDFSGIVEETGSNVTGFKKGDEVFGCLPNNTAGSVAEFAIAEENLTVLKPVNLSFAEAAALPLACVSAITALIDKGGITKNMDILINGCSGGVGHLGVMVAKLKGANVSGSCSTSAISTAQKTGVDTIIDYTKTNVLNSTQKYDIIFDTAGNLKYTDCKTIMKPNSVFLELNPTLSNLFFGSIKNIFTGKKVKSIISKATPDKMEMIALWAKQEKLKPVIGKQYDFTQALQAYINMENGERNIGKTVIINQ